MAQSKFIFIYGVAPSIRFYRVLIIFVVSILSSNSYLVLTVRISLIDS